MIAQLRGRVAHRDLGRVVVDVGGVGYLVHVVAGERIPPRGEPVELHTSLQVREDAMTLYGFTDRDALVLFELLLTASGVGPKLALAAVGTHRPDVLRTAIGGADVATLTDIPGVGRKVAERLVLELKEKVGLPAAGLPAPGGTPGPDAEPTALAEVRDALLGLGYSAGEVQQALATLAAEAAEGAGGGGSDPAPDTSTLLRRALRTLAGSTADGGR